MHQHSQQLIDMKTGHDIHLCESGFDVIHQCIERVRLVYVVCMWCVCGVYVVCMWCVCGVYVVCMWCLCGVYVVPFIIKAIVTLRCSCHVNTKMF